MSRTPPNEPKYAGAALAVIESTLSLMAESGIGSLTTKRVSERAEVSTATIHYFFETKENLIYSAFEYMIYRFREETLTIRRSEDDPLERIVRSVEVHFSPSKFVGDPFGIWPQLWAYTKADARVARLFTMFSKRIVANHVADLRQIGFSREDAFAKATEVNALARGLWIENRIAGNISKSLCWSVLESALASVAAMAGRPLPKFGGARSRRKRKLAAT